MNTYGVVCVDIYGVNWGTTDTESVFSPIDGVERDIDLLDTNS